jgi:hypothetical protein
MMMIRALEQRVLDLQSMLARYQRPSGRNNAHRPTPRQNPNDKQTQKGTTAS